MAGSYYLLNTFTGENMQGNPTPVCLLNKALPVNRMHLLAKEFNAPVTAFIEPVTGAIYPIRYFTVTGEIPACGHATLGAAYVLLSKHTGDTVVFETIENTRLNTKRQDELIYMQYPKFSKSGFEIPAALMNALGITHIETHFFCRELESLFIELKHEDEVKHLSPGFTLLMQSTSLIKEVVVMSKAEDKGHDFVLRSFCPWIGIDEDPVTGSVHAVLGPYWQERLNKDELVAYQASEKGGELFIKPLQHTVEIGGYTKITGEGLLKV